MNLKSIPMLLRAEINQRRREITQLESAINRYTGKPKQVKNSNQNKEQSNGK